MPRLPLWQWIVAIAFLVFYGFAVFALTRDYYLRHPQGAAPVAGPHGSSPARLQDQPPAAAPEIAGVLRGEDPAPIDRLADELFTQGHYAEALPLYERLIELSPDDVEAHNDLGLARHYTGDTLGALEVLERGTEKDPAHQRIWLTLGFVRAAAGETAAAREALERARSLAPRTPVGEEAARLIKQLEKG